MEKSQFKVIDGGKSKSLFSQYIYLGGEVTDTRLMGVLGVHLHWERPYPKEKPHLHQYFYYDVEELGLETYRTHTIDSLIINEISHKDLFGGLGATMKPLTEREGRYLVSEFIKDTKKKKLSLPVEATDLEFITEVPVVLSMQEQKDLQAKICTDIQSDYQAIHYYLMRIFGKDEKGASYLCSPSFMEEGGPKAFLPDHGTFLKNTIEEYLDEAEHLSYLCESLVETENKHFLVMSELEVSHGEIFSANRRSTLELSMYEASMMLRRWEYVMVYEILDDPDSFDKQFGTYTLGAMRTEHSNGEMFMEFKRDNSHVNQRVFNLSDDVACLYYVTDFGQLILGGYSLEAVTQKSELLQKSTLASSLFPTSKYQFQEPVLYEFAESDFEDFEEFLKSLN
ncbi:MAG: hypothetical protein EOM59_10405 [Clostridia bacterium]|nr:hypothetical protein [Clostridia bacterium]